MAQPRKPIEPPADDGWRISDELWARLAPLLPPGKAHPSAATTRVFPTASRSTASSSCCGPAVNGKR